MIRLLSAGAVLLGACSFGGDFGGTRYMCGEGGRCPSGQSCVGGFCVEESPVDCCTDGDGPGPTPACGSLSILTDSFDTPAPGPNFYADVTGGLTVGETGGQLVISIAAGMGNGFAGYRTLHYYDGTEATLETQVGQVGGHNTLLEIRNHLDQTVQVAYEEGMIAATVFNVPGGGTRTERPYDPSQVHWRLRTTAGTMYWETSANRTTWNLLHMESPPPIDLRHVEGLLFAGGQLATASAARFDVVNPTVPAGLVYCPASELVDDFTAAPLEPIWQPYNNAGCTITETGGKVSMGFPGTGSVFCGMVARHQFDLSTGQLVIDSNDLPIRTNFVSYLQVVSPANNESRVEMSLDSGMWFGVNRTNGVNGPSAAFSYDRVMHRWWRVRGVGGDIELATSPDASTWTPRFTVTPAFDISRIEVNFGAGHYQTVVPAGTVTAALPGMNAP